MTAKSVLIHPQGLRPGSRACTCSFATALSIPSLRQIKRHQKLVIIVFLLEVKH